MILSCILILKSGRAFVENEFFIPFVWFLFGELFLIHGDKKKHYSVWGLTVLLVLSVCLATDTGTISTSAGMCPMAVFSIVMMPDISVGEMLELGKGKRYLLVCGMLLTLCVFIMRIVCAWTDTLLTGNYTYYIEKGPLKGTYTDENTFYTFSSIMSDLDAIPYTEDDILFCGRNTPLAYLYSGMNCGTMSTYLIEMDYEQLEQYYILHPDKFPTVVYYYHWISSSGTAGDADSFLNYIESKYEIYEVAGSLLAISVEGK